VAIPSESLSRISDRGTGARICGMSDSAGATAVPKDTPDPAATLPTTSHRVLRHIAGSDVTKIVALVVILSWLPLSSVPWHALTDTDIWWRLRSGEWITQHHHLPTIDPFSTTGADRPWIAYSWTFDVLMYQLAHNWDLAGVVAFEMLMWVLVTASLLHLLYGVLQHFWRSVALAGIGGFVLIRAIGPRPGSFNVLFFIWELDLLLRAERSGNKRLLLFVPMLLWIWANVHLQSVYGLVLLGIFCAEPLVARILGLSHEDKDPRIPSRWLWSLLAASFALTFITAYGAGQYKVWADVFHEARMYRHINEMRPMDFTLPLHYVLAILLPVSALLAGRLRRLRPTWIFLAIWGTLLSMRTERDIWLGTVISLTLIAVAMQEKSPAAERVQRSVWLAAAAGVMLVLVFALKTGPTNRQIVASVAQEMPVGAVAYIHEHHLQGPMFNDFDWGGYLIYALPEIPVSIDGRTNVHTEAQVERSLATWNLWTEWDGDPLLQRANVVVAQRKFPLTFALVKDPHFKAVFDDGVGIVLLRVAPAK